MRGEERRGDKEHAGIVQLRKIPQAQSQLITMHKSGHLVLEKKGKGILFPPL